LHGADALVLPAKSASWNGATLSACDATKTAPCIESSPGRTIAHVAGAGTLSLDAASVIVTGGSSTRALTIDVRASS
jgi:hypothetical protein